MQMDWSTEAALTAPEGFGGLRQGAPVCRSHKMPLRIRDGRLPDDPSAVFGAEAAVGAAPIAGP